MLVVQLAAQYGRTEGAIRARLKHMDDPTHAAYMGVRVISPPRLQHTGSQHSTEGWQSWPIVESGDWGLIYIPSERRFGYYEDEESENEAIVYFGAPLTGDGPYVYPRGYLRQPPFDGEFTSYGQPPASEKFSLSLQSPVPSAMLAALTPASAIASPRRGDTKLITLEMIRAGQTVEQVASARSLTPGTIQNHIVDLYKDGCFPEAPQLLDVTPGIVAEIRAINASLTGDDLGKLRPIKDRCAHSYTVIKLALAADR